MNSRTVFAAALATCLLAAAVADAQTVARPRLRLACGPEIAHFCPTAAPGRASMQCIRAHLGQASGVCRAAVEEARQFRLQNKAAMASGGGAPPQ